MTMNPSELAKKVERLIIDEIVREGNSDRALVRSVVRNYDLESLALGELMNTIIRSVRQCESAISGN